MIPPSGQCVHGDNKSANRIKLSQLIQELFHVCDLKPSGVDVDRWVLESDS